MCHLRSKSFKQKLLGIPILSEHIKLISVSSASNCGNVRGFRECRGWRSVGIRLHLYFSFTKLSQGNGVTQLASIFIKLGLLYFFKLASIMFNLVLSGFSFCLCKASK